MHLFSNEMWERASHNFIIIGKNDNNIVTKKEYKNFSKLTWFWLSHVFPKHCSGGCTNPKILSSMSWVDNPKLKKTVIKIVNWLIVELYISNKGYINLPNTPGI